MGGSLGSYQMASPGPQGGELRNPGWVLGHWCSCGGCGCCRSNLSCLVWCPTLMLHRQAPQSTEGTLCLGPQQSPCPIHSPLPHSVHHSHTLHTLFLCTHPTFLSPLLFTLCCSSAGRSPEGSRLPQLTGRDLQDHWLLPYPAVVHWPGCGLPGDQGCPTQRTHEATVPQ